MTYIIIESWKITGIFGTNWVYPFHGTGFFLNPLVTEENLLFSDNFSEYRKTKVTRNGLSPPSTVPISINTESTGNTNIKEINGMK